MFIRLSGNISDETTPAAFSPFNANDPSSSVPQLLQSETYKNYKSFLMELGLDRCQFNSNINSEMASIEIPFSAQASARVLFPLQQKSRSYFSSTGTVK